MPDQASHHPDASPGRFRAPRVLGFAEETLLAAPTSEPRRLLLVEQDDAMSDMLRQILSAHFQVEAVKDGLEGSHAARLRQPDLVIVDLYLPGTDSLTFIRSVRAEMRSAQLPIIMLAASMHDDLLLRCLTDGASNFLLKPFNPTELLMCIEVELNLRATHAEPTR